MAPGKGNDAVFSSSSDSSDSSDSSPLVWIQDTALIGYNFHNRYRLAQVVIQAICLLALIIITIASWTIKNRAQSVRPLFRWFRFGAAMTMALVYFGFSFTYTILSEKQAVVAVVFYLISSILYSTAYVAEIFLLVTIFALLTHLNKRVAPNGFLAKLPFIWTYGIFCAVLFALYLAILVLQIQYQVGITQNGFYSIYFYGYFDYDHYLQILRTDVKIELAYNALYLGSSITILVLATSTSMRLLKEQTAKQKLMAIFLAVLIAFPLFLRSVIKLAFVAAYSLDYYARETPSGAVAETFFYCFCTAVIFAGLVAIAFQLAKDVPEQEHMMYSSPEVVMDPNAGHYGGDGIVTNGQQNYLQGWNKQPQATQQHVSPYYEQSSILSHEEQSRNDSTYGDSRVSRQPQPGMDGQVATHGMNGHGHSPEVAPVSPIR